VSVSYWSDSNIGISCADMPSPSDVNRKAFSSQTAITILFWSLSLKSLPLQTFRITRTSCCLLLSLQRKSFHFCGRLVFSFLIRRFSPLPRFDHSIALIHFSLYMSVLNSTLDLPEVVWSKTFWVICLKVPGTSFIV